MVPICIDILSPGGKSVLYASTKRSGSCSSLYVCSVTEQHRNARQNAMAAILRREKEPMRCCRHRSMSGKHRTSHTHTHRDREIQY